MQPNIKVGATASAGIIIFIVGCVLGWYGFPVIIDNMLEKVSQKSQYFNLKLNISPQFPLIGYQWGMMP